MLRLIGHSDNIARIVQEKFETLEKEREERTKLEFFHLFFFHSSEEKKTPESTFWDAQ